MLLVMLSMTSFYLAQLLRFCDLVILKRTLNEQSWKRNNHQLQTIQLLTINSHFSAFLDKKQSVLHNNKSLTDNFLSSQAKQTQLWLIPAHPNFFTLEFCWWSHVSADERISIDNGLYFGARPIVNSPLIKKTLQQTKTPFFTYALIHHFIKWSKQFGPYNLVSVQKQLRLKQSLEGFTLSRFKGGVGYFWRRLHLKMLFMYRQKVFFFFFNRY